MSATVGSVVFGPRAPVSWPENATELALLEARLKNAEMLRDASMKVLRDARRMMGLKTGDDFLLAIATLLAAANGREI